jgi:hypothetical protein
VILGSEVEPTTAPEVRTASWSAIVDTTANSHEKFRELLKSAVSMPQGGSHEFGMADAGVIASAIMSLRDSMALLPVPTKVSETPNWMSDLALLANVARRVTERLPGICDDEEKLLSGRAERLLVMLRRRSIGAHADRVSATLDQISRIQPDASHVAIQKWRQELKRLPEKKLMAKLEEWLSKYLDDNRVVPNDAGSHLGELCEAPAGELNLVYSILNEGENAVDGALQFVEAYVAQDGHSGSSIGTVHDVGSKILAAAARARTVG